MKKPIDILVLADRDSRALLPLAEALPPPLLPVGGRPLVAQVIEALATCVTARVTLVVAAGDTLTPAYFANRGFPRLALTITDQPVPVVDRDMLVFRGDIVSSHAETQAFVAEHGGEDAPACHRPDIGAWRLVAGDLTPTWRHAAMLADHSDRMLPSVAAYGRMCLAAARNEISGLEQAGWVEAEGARIGVDARIATRRALGANVLIGARAFIDKFAMIGENVVIGDDCHIGRGAALSNAVVMPGSYVGPGIELSNVVISGAWLCRIDTGSATRISDETVLSRLAA